MSEFTLSHLDTWIFDLDNTLYPRSCDLFAQIDVKMTNYVAGLLKTDDLVLARKVQKDLFKSHGTTLHGLMNDYQIDPIDFLDYVHDIDYAPVKENPQLEKALGRLPGRKFVFTNGDVPHAKRTLERLGVSHHFDDIFDIIAAGLTPKPARKPYEMFVNKFGIDPSKAIMFEDMARNLAVPKSMGMMTVLVKPDAGALGEAWEHEGYESPFIDFQTDNLPQYLSDLMV